MISASPAPLQFGSHYRLGLIQWLLWPSWTQPVRFVSEPESKIFEKPETVSSEISDCTPCTHAQSNIVHTRYADKTDY